MRSIILVAVLVVSGLCFVASDSKADDASVTVKFVEFVVQDGNAVLVVEIRNVGSTTQTSLTYGCWTEESSKIEGESGGGSRYMAFNTGGVNWTGELKPGQVTTARAVVAGMPADMVPMFSDQQFACGIS
ncbi:MAG: hypothetical protein WBN09_06545 [Woeseiaceae bacterium]